MLVSWRLTLPAEVWLLRQRSGPETSVTAIGLQRGASCGIGRMAAADLGARTVLLLEARSCFGLGWVVICLRRFV